MPTKRRRKRRLKDHKPQSQNTFLLMITLLTTSPLIALELIKSSRDGVRKAREAYLIERGKTLEPLGMNTVFTSSICYHLFTIFTFQIFFQLLL